MFKERASEAIKGLMKGDEDVVVWWTTWVECLSALSRRKRERVLSPGTKQKQGRPFRDRDSMVRSPANRGGAVAGRAASVNSSPEGKRTPCSLRQPSYGPGNARGLEFVCLDQNLREAALKEGFSIQPNY